MAKDKTRARALPDWLKSRKTNTVRTSEAMAAVYGVSCPNLVGWHDQYGGFVRGARVR